MELDHSGSPRQGQNPLRKVTVCMSRGVTGCFHRTEPRGARSHTADKRLLLSWWAAVHIGKQKCFYSPSPWIQEHMTREKYLPSMSSFSLICLWQQSQSKVNISMNSSAETIGFILTATLKVNLILFPNVRFLVGLQLVFVTHVCTNRWIGTSFYAPAQKSSNDSF